MTEPQIWTVISLTGAVFLAFLAYVGGGLRDNTRTLQELSLWVQRHDFSFEKIDAKLTDHDRRFDGVDAKLMKIDAKMTEHDRRFDGVDAELAEMRAIGESLGGQFFSLAKKLDEHLRGHAST